MVLKYQSKKPKKDGSLPEPIFFEPNNEQIGAETFEESKPRNDGFWRAEPCTDSWHLVNNPDGKLKRSYIPIHSRYDAYVTRHVTMASPEETAQFFKLKFAHAQQSKK